jgi:hypothetical protein
VSDALEGASPAGRSMEWRIRSRFMLRAILGTPPMKVKDEVPSATLSVPKDPPNGRLESPPWSAKIGLA